MSLIATAEQRLAWNELMLHEHPCGTVLHGGGRVRDLIESDHGVPGAFGLAATALAIETRDEWMGWSLTA